MVDNLDLIDLETLVRNSRIVLKSNISSNQISDWFIHEHMSDDTLKELLESPVFGYNIYGVYSDSLKKWFELNNERLIKDGYTQDEIDSALPLYDYLCEKTCTEYFDNRNELFKDKSERMQFIEEINRLQENVLLTGKIDGLSEKFAMSEAEAWNQCDRANEAFTSNPRLQKLLADANYSFFTGRTMATAGQLFEFENLGDFYSEGMPHLTASNAAIGYSVKEYILDRANAGETKFTITDIGSGSGATLAAILLGLREADGEFNDKLDHKITVNINSIEGCREFYDYLNREVFDKISGIANGFNNISLNISDSVNGLGIYGDVDEVISDCSFDGTSIFTSNYVFHRLPHDTKTDIIRKIRRNVGDNDAAFFLADIYKNDSAMPNRRYFNFAINGPLNPGDNPYIMLGRLAGNGFDNVHYDGVMKVDGSNKNPFNYLPVGVRKNCVGARENKQGFFMTAYKHNTS